MTWRREKKIKEKKKKVFWGQTLTTVLRDLEFVLRDLEFNLRDLDFDLRDLEFIFARS